VIDTDEPMRHRTDLDDMAEEHAMRAHIDPVASLNAAIHAAFKNEVSSSAVADLIREAEAAAILSAETAEKARTRALDPALSAADVATARREMEDASFGRDLAVEKPMMLH